MDDREQANRTGAGNGGFPPVAVEVLVRFFPGGDDQIKFFIDVDAVTQLEFRRAGQRGENLGQFLTRTALAQAALAAFAQVAP